jgi:hypothetical protein
MTETIPTTWDAVRDTAFFRIVAGLFDDAFVYGAGVLLGSYDPALIVAPVNLSGALSSRICVPPT